MEKQEIEDILFELDDMKYEFELDGVELTDRDAVAVLEEMKNGSTKDQAMRKVLGGICDILECLTY